MRFNLSLLRFLSFSLFLTISGITARAQSDRGTIAGTVLDSSGGVVANVTVTATSTETGANYGATTGPTGGFRIQNVRVGTYDVSVSAPGFKIEKKTGVVVQVNSTATVEFSLQAGDVKETLTVLADAPAIQTETSDIGTVVSTKQIEELPLALNGTGQSHLRSVESFVFLTPGTVGPGTFSDSPSSGIFESKISNGSNVKPRDHQNDYGGSLGGPVRIPKLYNGHDKTFFFFSWEQYRNNQGGVLPITLPTDAERQGDFSALQGLPTGLINPCDNSPVLRGQIFDPTTASCPTGFVGGRLAFPGNKINIPLSPVAQKVLSYLTVHADATKGLTNNFIFISNNPILDTTMSFRIDENWGNSNKFFFSYSSRDQEQFNGTQALPAPLDSNFFKSRFSHYLRFGWDKTISSSLLNHFNVGFNRLYDPSKADSFTGQDWPKTLGIPGANGVLFPVFSFDANALAIGYQGFSAGNFDIAIPNGLIVAASVTWIKSRHAFRIGFEWRASQFSRFNNTNTSPNYEFSNFQTAFAAGDPQTRDSFARFLLGLPH